MKNCSHPLTLVLVSSLLILGTASFSYALLEDETETKTPAATAKSENKSVGEITIDVALFLMVLAVRRAALYVFVLGIMLIALSIPLVKTAFCLCVLSFNAGKSVVNAIKKRMRRLSQHSPPSPDNDHQAVSLQMEPLPEQASSTDSGSPTKRAEKQGTPKPPNRKSLKVEVDISNTELEQENPAPPKDKAPPMWNTKTDKVPLLEAEELEDGSDPSAEVSTTETDKTPLAEAHRETDGPQDDPEPLEHGCGKSSDTEKDTAPLLEAEQLSEDDPVPEKDSL